MIFVSGDARLTWLSQQARIDCDCLYPVITPKASDFILKFDEHSIMDKFKFGVLYQKFGQLTEESIFGNRTHSPAMEEFLDMLGRKVELSQHEGYRGGLDTRHGQTGITQISIKCVRLSVRPINAKLICIERLI